jgi:hypothetical protein
MFHQLLKMLSAYDLVTQAYFQGDQLFKVYLRETRISLHTTDALLR